MYKNKGRLSLKSEKSCTYILINRKYAAIIFDFNSFHSQKERAEVFFLLKNDSFHYIFLNDCKVKFTSAYD